MTAYRYPDDGPDPAAEIERLRRVWLDARSTMERRRHEYYDAVRAEILAGLAFHDAAVDDPGLTS